MTSAEFGAYMDTMRPTLKAYGQFVIDKVTQHLKANLEVDTFSQLFKIPPSRRVKDTASAVEKIQRKRYLDPKEQMTDIVGVRFVVLLQSDMDLVSGAIETIGDWTARKDRSPLVEIDENPEAFQYQSVHYVVRLNEEVRIDDFVIPADTPCEIQVRTLVQHAYAEFVHDRVYKGDGKIPSHIRRLVARAMAMLESTDEIFEQASKELSEIQNGIAEWQDFSSRTFSSIGAVANCEVTDDEHLLFFETYKGLLFTASFSDVRNLFSIHAQKIGELSSTEGGIFSSHLIVPLLWLIQNHDQQVLDRWSLTKYQRGLESAGALLGINLARSG